MPLAFLFNAQNFDLLTVGIAIAAIGILGFVVFLENPKSATNRAFALIAVVTILYGSANYINYQVSDPTTILWLIRLVIFFAVWHAFSLFHLFYVFPHREVSYPWWYMRLLLPVTAFTSLLTLSPLVFPSLATVAPVGLVSTPEVGFGVVIFGPVVFGLIASAIVTLIQKTLRAHDIERKQFAFVLTGTVIGFGLLLVFNLALPTVLQDVRFVSFSAVFLFPFIAFTTYAIMKYRLLNVKVIGTEVVAFILSIVTLLQIIFARDLTERLFTTVVFALVLSFSFGLIRGVTNEVRQREEIELLADNLKKANDKLKELDKLKSEFLSIATHELRTPITIVRNFVSLLLDGTYGKVPVAAEEAGRQVFERATDMAKVVDSYLSVSRVEQGKIKYDLVDTDLAQLVQQDVEALIPNAEKRHLALTLTIAPGAASMHAKIDAPKITEVISNLIDNSIKYTPKGSIAVGLERVGNRARLTIKDTGVGMTPKTMANLFKLFSPGEDSKKINPASTGVGLYISKAHVEANKGIITAASDGEGKGSQFVVELPLSS